MANDAVNEMLLTGSPDALYSRLDANKVLNAFGKYGKYQMLTYFSTTTMKLLSALSIMVMPFVAEDPNFECHFGEETHYTAVDSCTLIDSFNKNASYQCSEVPNARYVFEDTRSSLAAEFGLVCDKKGTVEHASAVFLFGGMLISPIMTQLSDLFGRRLPFILPIFLFLSANIAGAFAPNFTVFLISRFVAGLANACFYIVGMTLCLESVSTKLRDLIPIWANVTWVVGYLLAGILKIYIPDWRHLYLTTALVGLIALPFVWMTHESLHWMIAKRKNKEIKKYIERSSKFNNREIDLQQCISEEHHSKEVTKRTAIDVFTTPALFVQFAVNSYILITLSLSYWGLSLFSTDLSEDRMTGFFLSGLVEIPATILTQVMVVYMDRKTVSIVSLTVQALAMAGAAVFKDIPALALIFPLIAKCFNAVTWSSQCLLLSEASPTSVRNVFSGLVAFVGEIGGVVAPYLKRLTFLHPNAPAILISAMSFIGAALVFGLPETKNKELAEDIDDENFDEGPLARFFFGRHHLRNHQNEL